MLKDYIKKNMDVYIAWIIANVLDAFTTLYGILALNLSEFNPIANAVISISVLSFLAMKTLVTAFALILPRFLLIIFTVWLYLIVLFNSYLIFSII